MKTSPISKNIQEKYYDDDYKLKEKLHFLKCLEKYFTNICQGPTETCSSCGCLCFPKSVATYNENKLEDKKSILSNWKEVCKIKTNDNIILCYSCRNDIFRNKLPESALINGLELPNIPLALQDLSSLEERFIASRIPFMQIRVLRVGRQFGMQGDIVNVPTEVDTNVSILPRTNDELFTLPVKLMKRMRDKNHYAFETIRPNKIFEAVKFLVEQPLYKKENIKLSEEWLKQNKDILKEHFNLNEHKLRDSDRNIKFEIREIHNKNIKEIKKQDLEKKVIIKMLYPKNSQKT